MHPKQGLTQAYAVIWDHSSKTIKDKVGQLPNYDESKIQHNPVSLLEEIGQIIRGHGAHSLPVYWTAELIKIVYVIYQHANVNNETYKKQFEPMWELIK